MLKNKLNTLFIALFISHTSYANAQSSVALNKSVIVKIGSAAPKSGEISHLGIDNENGVRLAIDEINARGDLKIGGNRIHLVMVGKDDAADPEHAVLIAQKLVDSGVVGVVGHLNSGVSIPANSVYAEAGIVQVSPSSTNPDYTLKSKKTVDGNVSAYRVVANDAQQAPALAKYLKSIGGKSVVILGDGTQYGEGFANGFEESAQQQGMNVIAQESVTDKTEDFRGLLTKIKAMNPDYIVWGGMDNQAALLAKQMKQLGMTTSLASGDGACTEKFIELAGKSSEGMICTYAGEPLMAFNERGLRFIQKYEKRFSGLRVQIYAPYAYDATYAIVQAMQLADSIDKKAILEAMPRVDFEGVTGRIRFDANGDTKNGGITINQVRNKKLDYVKSVYLNDD
ncbi:branched-chain amino acid ABC transporter substrate-binding protein [Hydromonas duriensis]|uniref:Branched-chain amino acid transport system substrate-binding protein n=1 Tax=Hydromonas duriensis TaxID=1527608 RepID=A0A4R6Y657_9BURK|nr:branched-chain amino acid ABC transporter substrate-binding protein [Hydromonas duriensis]TDR31055.1 branched-chain amino acid transport system substrate-binding protein [Hydromonas duriensis]